MIEEGVKEQDLLEQINALERVIKSKLVRGERCSDEFELRRQLQDKYQQTYGGEYE